MWTEREKVITNFEEAIEYIESKEFFHDYRLSEWVNDVLQLCV